MIDISFFNVPDGHKLGVWTQRADMLYGRNHVIDAPFEWGDILLLLPDGRLMAIGNVSGPVMFVTPPEVLAAMDWLTE